jgi:hypothetical protein
MEKEYEKRKGDLTLLKLLAGRTIRMVEVAQTSPLKMRISENVSRLAFCDNMHSRQNYLAEHMDLKAGSRAMVL